MTYDQIVSHLADEAKQRIKRGLSQTYKHAILKACDGNYGMMQAVGAFARQTQYGKASCAQGKDQAWTATALHDLTVAK